MSQVKSIVNNISYENPISFVNRHWDIACNSVKPLLADSTIITHSSNLFLVESTTARYVLKRRQRDGIQRKESFHRVKADVLARCHKAGLHVSYLLSTISAEPFVVTPTFIFELSPYFSGKKYSKNESKVDVLYHSLISLTYIFQDVSEQYRDEIASQEIPPYVDQPDPYRALVDARNLLKHHTYVAGWSEILVPLLEDINLLGVSDMLNHKALSETLVHGDLHSSHWLFNDSSVAFIDFDNLRIDDSALDFAWVADAIFEIEGKPDKSLSLLKRSIEDGVLSKEEVISGIKTLIVYAVPIVVDIAKDIYIRKDLRNVWKNYLSILDVNRKCTLLEAVNQNL